jgi:hypothetical protein
VEYAINRSYCEGQGMDGGRPTIVLCRLMSWVLLSLEPVNIMQEKTKQLLAEAGYSSRFDTIYVQTPAADSIIPYCDLSRKQNKCTLEQVTPTKMAP